MPLRSDRLSLLFANVGHLLSHLLMLLYPTVVLALDGRFGLSYGELLSLSMPGFVLYGAAALPAGWLGDRWSAEGMMVVFFVGSGLAAIGTGLATGPLGLAIGLAFIGIFGAIYHPVGVAWLVRNAENRGRVLGWNGIFGSLGVGLASVVAAALTALAGWRAAFIVPGGVTLLVGVALALAVRSGAVVASRADRRPLPEPGRADMRRAFIALSVTMTAAGLIWQATTVALPKLFDERLVGLTHGGTLGTGGLVSLVFMASAATQLLGGWLADRYPLKRVYVLAWAVQVPLLTLVAGVVELPLLAAATLVYCLMTIATPAENSLLALYTPGRWRATAFGAKFLLSLGVSAAGVPLVAVIHDRTGDFAWLFFVLAALAAAIVAAGLLLPRDNAAVAGDAPVPVPAE
jgi:MFS family permease